MYLLIKKKEPGLEKSHLAVAFLGGFLFHFIGEAKSHYVMPYYLLLMPYAVQGYREMAGRLSKAEVGNLKEVRRLCQKRSAKKGILLMAVIIIISFLKIPAVTNTLKLGGEESDYIWYCTNVTQWKEADYKKV